MSLIAAGPVSWVKDEDKKYVDEIRRLKQRVEELEKKANEAQKGES